MIVLKPTVVFPSAGHHNSDPGAVANGYKEADLTKELRNLISDELNKRGHKHIMDKDDETNRQYQGRIRPGSGSVILDIHFDAAQPSAGGTTVFIPTPEKAYDISFASRILDATCEILGTKNRGVRNERHSQHKRIGILHKGAGISALVEVCFITNKEDIAKYQAHKHELAKAYAEILIEYDNLKQ